MDQIFAASVERHKGAVERARQLVTAAEKKAQRASRGVAESKMAHAHPVADAISAGVDDDGAGGAGIVRAARGARAGEGLLHRRAEVRS
jgi:hypothetical protein